MLQGLAHRYSKKWDPYSIACGIAPEVTDLVLVDIVNFKN